MTRKEILEEIYRLQVVDLRQCHSKQSYHNGKIAVAGKHLEKWNQEEFKIERQIQDLNDKLVLMERENK